ncbi:MAG: transcription elongation factor GreA [Dehalococcoidia bacterium]|nr:transcription elongation factor GreA [Dehalococcoidia bacterium]
MAERMTAGEAVAHFLQSIDPEKARLERPQIDAFIEAFGTDRAIGDLATSDVAAYARTFQQDDIEDAPQLEPVRAFLAYASRLAFTSENLVPALRLGPSSGGGSRGDSAVAELGGDAYQMTVEGLAALEKELEELKGERPRIAEELRAAMADKDFRENAPLDAARDAQAHLEARIRDIEARLRHAVIIDPSQKQGRANVGSTVKLLNISSSKEQTFHLVSPNEVDPSKGKISIESPVGHAVINRRTGEEVFVEAPSGRLHFRLLEVID